MAQSAVLGPSKEAQAHFLLPGSDKRPADVLIPHWVGSKDAALGVTVIKPLQVAQAAVTHRSTQSLAYSRKVISHGQLFWWQVRAFLPIAVESLGAWHMVVISKMRKLGAVLLIV